MAKGMPSMVALLGLLAVAGYQNRDKLQDMLGGRPTGQPGSDDLPGSNTGQPGGLDSILGGLGGLFGGAGAAGGLGSVLSGGLGDLVDRFNQSGQGAKADSWVHDGANEPVDTTELEQTLGAETIDTLTKQTGLDRQELLERLAKVLPDAVNTLTPEGRVPTEEEASRIIG